MTAEFDCPFCGHTNEYDDDDDQEFGFPCGNCPATIDLEYEDGYVAVMKACLKLECQCLKCAGDLALEITEKEGSDTGFCSKCKSKLLVTWSDSDVDDVEITETTIDFYCPCDGTALRLAEITSEDGGKEMLCRECDHNLSVTWCDWQLAEISVG